MFRWIKANEKPLVLLVSVAFAISGGAWAYSAAAARAGPLSKGRRRSKEALGTWRAILRGSGSGSKGRGPGKRAHAAKTGHARS